MPKAPEGYQPLLNRGSRGSLWLADDHVLIIENTRFLLSIRETYRRLDFSNIRAVLHAPSARGAWLVAVFALLLLFSFGIVALAGFTSRSALVFAGIIALPCLVGLIGHLIKGPTHSLTIQTTVRPWRIKAVTRQKHVTKVLAALEPLCREAQNEVSTASHAADPSAAHSPLTAAPLPFGQTNDPLPVQGTHPLAMPAWLCLLAFAAMMAGELLWNSMAASLIMMGFATAFFVLLMIAFTRGGGTLATGGRGVFIFALSMLGVSVVAGYGAAMAGMFQSSLRGRGSDTGSEEVLLRALAQFPDGSPTALSYVGMAVAALTGISAAAGIAAVLHRNKLRNTSMQTTTPDSP